MTESEIIWDAGDRIRTGEITNITAFAKRYKLNSTAALHLYHQARDYGMAYGVDMFPPPNHQNTLKEMNR